MEALRVLGAAFRAVWGHFAVSILANTLALVLCLPIVVALSLAAHLVSLSILPLGVVVLLGVLPNPALAGVQASGHCLLGGEVPTLLDQGKAIARYWRAATLAWLLGALVVAVIVLNLAFYSKLGAGRSSAHWLGGPIEVIWLVALALWLSLHLYIYPLLVRQDHPGLVQAYRNALVLVARRPFFSLGVSLIWLAWLILGATTGLAYVAGLAVAALLQQAALSQALSGLAPVQQAT